MNASTEEARWVVQAVAPKDYYDGCTLRVDEWLAKCGHDGVPLTPTEAWAEFMQAVAVVTQHRLWEWQLRQEPRVAYDAVSDRHYFIFKIDNNGTTFLVAGRKMDGPANEV